jgi:hypothetical protein
MNDIYESLKQSLAELEAYKKGELKCNEDVVRVSEKNEFWKKAKQEQINTTPTGRNA